MKWKLKIDNYEKQKKEKIIHKWENKKEMFVESIIIIKSY